MPSPLSSTRQYTISPFRVHAPRVVARGAVVAGELLLPAVEALAPGDAAEALGCERKEDCLVLREAIEDPRERLDRTAGLLAAVAERAEIPPSSVYHFFASVPALLEALIEQALAK